jgi:preprotein translocase subunit SecD
LTNIQKYLISLALVLAVVGGSLYLLITRPPKLGLDLQGGLTVVLTAVSRPGAPVTEEAMRQALFIINQRVNKLGVAEPEIERQGPRNILIQLPGIRDPEEALQIIGQTALLEFKIVKPEFAGQGVQGLNKLVSQDKEPLGPTLLTGKSLESAKADFDPKTNEPEVSIRFTREGSGQFAEITGQNVQKRLAIVLDDRVMSAPTISERIPSGRAVITGIKTVDETKRIVLVLQTGALPVKLIKSTHRTVGPTLGRDSLLQGLRAGAIGLMLVFLFMVLYYRAFGVVTWMALVIFSALLGGLLVLVGATLTLPGIAGIVFMFGSAADSSIIVFERIKEEVRGGKTVRVSMDTGFMHGFKTFLDADLVTLTTAAVLFYFGIGPVKGFALTLMLGIASDLFTSFFFTRSALGLLGKLRLFSRPALIGVREARADEV